MVFRDASVRVRARPSNTAAVNGAPVGLPVASVAGCRVISGVAALLAVWKRRAGEMALPPRDCCRLLAPSTELTRALMKVKTVAGVECRVSGAEADTTG